ncbi:hypothetical protein AB0B12_20160 [Streptomyces sp. NPDC044780]|uniref:hypothetical protein n=1 Tax=unclassified Streptomyces TaxID=2593676 RepID=UPI0033E20C91
MDKTYLSAVGEALGEPRKVSELATSVDTDLTALIEEIAHFRESPRDIWELAADAAEQTLAHSPHPPDLIVYVSENDPDTAASLARLGQRLRLPAAEHLALSGRDCGNLAPALETASALLATGRYERVLLVLADRARAGRRVMASGLSVFSDGAAACLLTRRPPAAGPVLRVEAVAGRTAVRPDDDPARQGVLTTARLASDSVAALLDVSGLTWEDVTQVVLPNYRPTAQRFLTAALGVPAGRLSLGPVTDIGHCFSADPLLTVGRRAAAGALAAGDVLLTAVFGPHTCSAIAFRRL